MILVSSEKLGGSEYFITASELNAYRRFFNVALAINQLASNHDPKVINCRAVVVATFIEELFTVNF